MKQIASLPLYATEDYDVFEKLQGNRDFNLPQVKKLVQVIESGNTHFTRFDPVLVNAKMEIIDGQHRIEAYRRYKEKTGNVLPIYFIQMNELGIEHARSMNAGSKPWSPDDYAKAYANEGLKSYKTFLKFRATYGLNAEILIKYLAPSNPDMRDFRAGEFKTEDVVQASTYADQLIELGPLSGLKDAEWKNRGFALALLSIMSQSEYSQARMMTKMQRHARTLEEVPVQVKAMREALLRIYNKETPPEDWMIIN